MVGTHRRRTLRGLLESSATPRRLIVDDGRLTHAYKVTSFQVWATSLTGARDVQGVLGLDYDMAQFFNAEDSRQIAWASQMNDLNGGLGSLSIIDPDHLVLRDLYLVNFGPPGNDLNYLIELETVEISDDQAILTLIKERSQDDIR